MVICKLFNHVLSFVSVKKIFKQFQCHAMTSFLNSVDYAYKKNSQECPAFNSTSIVTELFCKMSTARPIPRHELPRIICQTRWANAQTINIRHTRSTSQSFSLHNQPSRTFELLPAILQQNDCLIKFWLSRNPYPMALSEHQCHSKWNQIVEFRSV